MAQSVKCSSQNLTLDAQHPHKTPPEGMMCACDPRTGEAEPGRWLGFDGWSVQLSCEPQVQCKTLSHEIGGE